MTTLLAFLMQIGSALHVNTQSELLQPEALSGILDYEKNDPFNGRSMAENQYFGEAFSGTTDYEKDNPLDSRSMTDDEYYDDFYDKTEWEQSATTFTPDELPEFLVGTDGRNNLCMKNHFVPELFVYGGIKTGTTTLCSMLRGSPAVLWSLRRGKEDTEEHPAGWKEGRYFDLHKLMGVNYMISDFPNCTSDYRSFAVDGSARYSSDPAVVASIANWYRESSVLLKFVLIMRDPVARLHSHYYHSKKDKWCLLHQKYNFSQTVDQILTYQQPLIKNPDGVTFNPFRMDREKFNPDQWEAVAPKRQANHVPCSDFTEGSLYANHIRTFLKNFNPSQLIVVPFLHLADPGNGGRTSKHVAEFIWDLMGVRGKPMDIPRTNHRERPPIEDDISEWQIQNLRIWFDKLTGPAVLADLIVRVPGMILYDYNKDPKDAAQIAKWISANW